MYRRAHSARRRQWACQKTSVRLPFWQGCGLLLLAAADRPSRRRRPGYMSHHATILGAEPARAVHVGQDGGLLSPDRCPQQIPRNLVDACAYSQLYPWLTQLQLEAEAAAAAPNLANLRRARARGRSCQIYCRCARHTRTYSRRGAKRSARPKPTAKISSPPFSWGPSGRFLAHRSVWASSTGGRRFSSVARWMLDRMLRFCSFWPPECRFLQVSSTFLARGSEVGPPTPKSK
mmetsp:Transcript_25776/g.74574  ORF Transcript_25776/g.74574 Transcript_25776/m.74574 type:complete len:233 (-) Transcript_25776:77-775(-)